MTRRYLVLLTWLAAGSFSPVLAQRVGPEFRVNTYTTGRQDRPAVASDATGNFIVVWESVNQDGSRSGVFGQRYDNGGRRLGAEFLVNTITAGIQARPDVASDANGNFVVVWESNGLGNGQRFDRDGNPLGAEFAVSEIPGLASGHKTASDATGNFVVVWNMDRADGGEFGVFGQRFDKDGNRLGDTFQVNTFTTGDQYRASVASDATGNFIVVWDSNNQDGFFFGVFGQRYDSAGEPLGGEFQVNTYTTQDQRYPSVASDPVGNFVVVWDSRDGQDGSSYGVFGQRYDSSGNPLGGEFQVNTYTRFDQRAPSVASDPNGNFVVAWISGGQDGYEAGIFGQRYDSSGNRVGGEFQVNTYTLYNQQFPRLASDAAGNFVVVWDSHDGQDGSSYGVFGQRFSGGCRSTASAPTSLCPVNPR